MRSIARLALVGSLITVGVQGCGEDRASQLSPRSDVVVVLPPTPDLTPPKVVTNHPDGTLTVAGLILERAKHVDQMVEVRGKVILAHTCETRDDCHPPAHVLLSDRKDDEQKLLVAGFSDGYIQQLTVGQELTLHGRFGLVTPDGLFIRQTGLLVVEDPKTP